MMLQKYEYHALVCCISKTLHQKKYATTLEPTNKGTRQQSTKHFLKGSKVGDGKSTPILCEVRRSTIAARVYNNTQHCAENTAQRYSSTRYSLSLLRPVHSSSPSPPILPQLSRTSSTSPPSFGLNSPKNSTCGGAGCIKCGGCWSIGSMPPPLGPGWCCMVLWIVDGSHLTHSVHCPTVFRGVGSGFSPPSFDFPNL